METITPQWSRENLDRMNKNFGKLAELPETLNKEMNEVKNAVEGKLNEFFQPSLNLFNKNGLLLSDTSITTGGKNVARDGYSTTNYLIRVEGTTSYQATASYYYAQWDKDGNFLKYAFVSYKTALITEPTTTSISIATLTSGLDSFMFAKGTVPLSAEDYQPYQIVLNGINDPQVIEASEGFGSLSGRFTEIDTAIEGLGGSSISVTDAEAEAVFVAAMNDVAVRIGMLNSKFVNSTGLTGAGQLTTAEDLSKLAKYACGYEALLRVWGAKSYTFKTKGTSGRSITIETTVTDATFENSYKILGGKTGTLGVNINVTGVFQGQDGKTYVASILKADSDRWSSLKQLLDSSATVEATSGYAMELQGTGPLFQNVPSPVVNSKAPQTKIAPASCTKVLTAIVLLESGMKLDETITLKESDIQSGSGPVFTAGEKISVLDALYLMMLPSSNTAAKAVARAAGKSIVMTRGYK